MRSPISSVLCMMAFLILSSCSRPPERVVDLQTYNSFYDCWSSNVDHKDSFSAFFMMHEYQADTRIVEAFSSKCVLNGSNLNQISSRFLIGFNNYRPKYKERNIFGNYIISNKTSHIEIKPLGIYHVEGTAVHNNYGVTSQLIITLKSVTSIKKVNEDMDNFIRNRIRGMGTL